MILCRIHCQLAIATVLSVPVLSVPVLCVLVLCVLLGTTNAADLQVASLVVDEPATAAEVYGEGVRPTDWRSPEDERLGFHLPPGFEIRLFAAEPDIAKPLNMAIDDRGRMWVTQSVDYPYPAAAGTEPSDAIMILEDSDGDGRADQFTKFADKLSIPIGILPYGNGCLCFSIPNLWYLQDTDGDGVCDRRDVVLGPFDTTRDTHGLVNSLRDGGDGWIYACHGFNNQSSVAGTDGNTVALHSGNTFRFRPDGSRVELYTQGQVNPFGMTRDHWGYLYSADCHSKPVSQLIRGACYPSFGRPDNGLGFLPPMIDHLHGSTAISGLVYVAPNSPIEPLRKQFISGNVMTSRLNRNALSFQGATARGIEQPDFMTSDDPWFRPVDLQMGPDGHIYVADFYNKIIGHYEVPLEHPGRDRSSGRIWQIRYTGGSQSSAATDHATNNSVTLPNHSGATDAANVAMSAEQILADIGDSSPLVRVAAWHQACETDAPTKFISLLPTALRDRNAHVKRAAAEFAGLHGGFGNVEPLTGLLAEVPDTDPVLQYSIRIALRSLMMREPIDSPVWAGEIDPAWLPILLTIPNETSAQILLRYLDEHPDDADAERYLMHAATYSGRDSLPSCVAIARRMTDGTSRQRWRLLDLICKADGARPGHVSPAIHDWAIELLMDQVRRMNDAAPMVQWSTRDDGSTSDGAAWSFEDRTSDDQQTRRLRSSLSRSEQYTGDMSSDYFVASDSISFWLAGHNSHPENDDHQKNRVQLVTAENGEVIREAFPPRSDIAKWIQWDTTDIQGTHVRLRVIDGDSGSAYAWIAFDPATPKSLSFANQDSSVATVVEWMKRLGMTELIPPLQQRMDRGIDGPIAQASIASAIASVQGRPGDALTLQSVCRWQPARSSIREAIAAVRSGDTDAIAKVTQSVCKRLSVAQQIQFATAWVSSGADVERLVAMSEAGWIGAAVLADPGVSQPLLAKATPDQQTRIAAITDGVDMDSASSKLLAELYVSVPKLSGQLEPGQQMFQKHCVACHQIQGVGAVVGPQLDGAAARSVARLLEDIVVPNLNVDQAFRTTSVLIDDGRVIVGLIRSETDDSVTIVDATGKPISIDVDAIEQRRDGGLSLMPNNFGEVMSPEQLSDLIHFIRQSKPAGH
ncbi:Cytochrome c [Rubripirellula lacrimiformis]|uniref:Cytochrome c n=1 Tax=Rubripirellula lacrimiformis TaxID=1930273 RepID=A0A517N6J2_9BACT|nr:PVC-type heme-binding CxxCH protein [Rubripirellula lacrimiformis]QDT02752.1 Cytochrome c [Rubripirellula lacrimiformis]